MGEIYSEDEFYKDNGWPSESLKYCDYCFYNGHKTEYGEDYDQFALVDNALYPYIRLTEKRGRCQSPCGHSSVIATDGSFARKSETERDKDCPKIAWGFAAVFLMNLRYDPKQEDYIEIKTRETLIKEYYGRYLQLYFDSHSGLKFSKLSLEQKELNFLEEHESIIRGFWEKSTPLAKYPELYDYAKSAEDEYEGYLAYRRNEILNKPEESDKKREGRSVIQNGDKSVYVETNKGTIIIESDMTTRKCFSTEIRETFGKQYIKVFFLDDDIATVAKDTVSAIKSVHIVNITESQSSAHPGKTLTVYPKPMVSAGECEKDIIEALNGLLTQGVIAEKRPVKNDAYFNGIADKIINDLDKARVSIHVCIAWFTNQKIADKLVEKYKQGVDVKVVYYDDHTNSKFGVNIDGISFKAVRGSRGGIMHNKYCIIDNQIVITGSYNWSDNAEKKNDENAAVMYDYDRASDYTVEFKKWFL